MQWTLEAMRINKGLTQQELADMFDVSPQTIARLEKDSSDIGYQILKKYMDTFHIKFDDIFLGKKIRKFRNNKLERTVCKRFLTLKDKKSEQ
ncbi:TPA: helix-turn-helix transcriptional regulator [Streptococcus agalactiae]